jgi:hypothetical protein
VPLLVAESRSSAAEALLREDDGVVAWWGTPVECASAIARLRREGRIDGAGESDSLRVMARLRTGWLEVEPSEGLRTWALRLIRVHALRAGDALQLAAAGVWAGSDPGRPFVTLDRRLADAARAAGFEAIIPTV